MEDTNASRKQNNERHSLKSKRPRQKGPRRETTRDEQLSRSLTWVLRHKAKSLGLVISDDGYIPLNKVLSCHKRFDGCSEEDVKRVVKNCSKQRFRLDDKDGTLHIRANQGHTIRSISDKELLVPLSKTDLCSINCIVHGTTQKSWDDHISKEGLSRMQRNHIHFALGLPADNHVISGMRSSSQIHIYVDGERCANDGIVFYRSDNNVILTAGVGKRGMLPICYFRKVVEARTGLELLSC